ncbi:MAG TPA: ABC transporter ATP-binding protein [Rectinemataceae bacterium]|nr:ABC transporter ATP-binding protein [Rectinemataceae bacterium]
MKPAILEARDLVFYFEKGRPLLKNLSISFARGELVVIAGRNGAGKTLLAKCLSAIYRSRKGSVLFQGKKVEELPGSPATRVAYLFQDARLQILGDSLLEDALFGPLAIGLERKAAEAKARASLEALGLGSRLDEAPTALSGGDLRRLAIASVLALDPEVLILDEPFANLDWQGVSDLLSTVKVLLSAGKTLLVLTHEIEKIVGLADRLVVLDRGAIVVDGKPSLLVGPDLEAHGLRNPLRAAESLADLSWLEPPSP